MVVKSYILFLFTITLVSVNAQINSRCTTPNGERAQCVSIYSCNILRNAVTSRDPDTIRFLRMSQCGYQGNPLVCCGSTANFQTVESTPTQQVSGSSSSSNVLRDNGLLPSRDNCGIQQGERILNGQLTAFDEFPWMALLNYRRASGGGMTFSCGGALISPRYVLTAAHCVTGEIRQRVGTLSSVRLGEWNTSSVNDCFEDQGFQECSDPPVDIAVEQAIPHPEYGRDRNRYHDIALIRLSRNVQYSDFIRPLCLPSSSNERSTIGQRLWVAGWGRTETGNFSPVKLKLDVPLVSNSECSQTFRTAGVNIQGTQMCAGGEREKDSCNGDSGGPLMARTSGNNNQWFAEGIVSFGTRCGTEYWPGIYTRVSEYIGWIQDNMRP